MSDPERTAYQRVQEAMGGEYAAPFLSRLNALEQEVAAERERRERAERLAGSLAQRLAAEHQRRLAAESAPEQADDPAPVLVGAVAPGEAAAPFARWRSLRPRAADVADRT